MWKSLIRWKLVKQIPFEKPLAWAQLSHQKIRLAVAITGVSFANILMFTMMGLQTLLTDGATTLHESLKGDLFLMSSFSPTLRIPITIPRAYLLQADSVEGVGMASPMYISNANWTDPSQLRPPSERFSKDSSSEGDLEQSPEEESAGDIFGNQVRIVAFNLEQPILDIPEVEQQRDRLSTANAVLFDRLSQPSLGEIPTLLSTAEGVQTLMGGRRVRVVGLFSLGSTVIEKGTVVMSDWNYTQWAGPQALEQVSLGILMLEAGSDVAAVQEKLQNYLPDSVDVLTMEELLAKEKKFTDEDPGGIIFGFGSMVGFVVGTVIVYQVLYTDISDHLPEYATLKAMGYSDAALLRVVLLEAILLAVLGFIPGFITSLGLYQVLTVMTRIPLVMKSAVAVQIFVLTLVMCSLSGAIAMRRLQSADPADVF
ncbi:FtsX-like permease family protein [cf. Phormidesmis sp. LEGE 11477]|uniref:FtsX-like permease family protein n=1 Tax=cf. Phormidesmis sp. LEGE 11477 TaxID=1828680 RepID=UPI00187E1B69|nr:FtsX-like permease family protein [cf. Phormidesmis sp. LEGE 11477]MBE9063178.1 FtsX-like permease family protein [cf. Phormidesmis sp. LEGE 11477]